MVNYIMNILIACEFSGIVRDAFRAKGHNAWSCDFLETERDHTYHLCGDVAYWLGGRQHGLSKIPWDMMVAFPPCTHLCVSGARWFKDKPAEQAEAVRFFLSLTTVDIPRIAIENPIGIMSNRYRKPDQIIQPWQFGHGETKATCLWLKNLPILKTTKIVEGREAKVHRCPPGPDRWKIRSRTFQGIGNAMADQWG